MKLQQLRLIYANKESAPTRGPWIEIPSAAICLYLVIVGPHTGAVD